MDCGKLLLGLRDYKRNANYCGRKEQALATVVLDSSLLYLLGEPEDPVAVWEKLASQFQRKTLANKLEFISVPPSYERNSTSRRLLRYLSHWL